MESPPRLRNGLADRHAADPEIGHLENDPLVLLLDQDVCRLEVAVDDGRVEPVGEADDLGQPQHHLRGLVGPDASRCAVPLLDQPAEVATRDVLVLQTRRVGPEVGAEQPDEARVGALALDPIQQGSLVTQGGGRVGVDAEFQGHRGVVLLVGIPGLPDLPEAADAKQFDQFQVQVSEGEIALLEPGQPRRQQGEQVVGLPQHQPCRDRGAGRVGGPP